MWDSEQQDTGYKLEFKTIAHFLGEKANSQVFLPGRNALRGGVALLGTQTYLCSSTVEHPRRAVWQFRENLGVAEEEEEPGDSGVLETSRQGSFQEGGVVSSVTCFKGQDKI